MTFTTRPAYKTDLHSLWAFYREVREHQPIKFDIDKQDLELILGDKNRARLIVAQVELGGPFIALMVTFDHVTRGIIEHVLVKHEPDRKELIKLMVKKLEHHRPATWRAIEYNFHMANDPAESQTWHGLGYDQSFEPPRYRGVKYLGVPS